MERLITEGVGRGGIVSSSGYGRSSDVIMATLPGAVAPPSALGALLRQRGGTDGAMVMRAGRLIDDGRIGGGGGGICRWSVTAAEAAAGWRGGKYGSAKCSKIGGESGHHALQKRFTGRRLESFLSAFSRKTEVVEEVPQRIDNFDFYNDPWWVTFARGIVSGCEGQRQIGVEKKPVRNGFASIFLRLSLICSLYLASHWYAPDSAVARAESLDVSGQSYGWQEKISTNSFLSHDSKKLNLAVEKVLRNDYIPLKNYQDSVTVGTSSVLRSAKSPPDVMFSLAEANKACHESYGFLPCSDSTGGNLSLMVAYGYLLLLAAQLISNGSELLLEVMNPGLLGGLLLPILGALPDALLIFVSGVGGTVEEAQQQVMVGIGVLAGSIVMLLTLGWAGSLYAGRCDLSGPGGTAEDRTLTRSLDWTGTGVTTDEQTRVGAWIMILSALPFLVVQIPLLDGHPAEGPEAALVGSIFCAIGILAYSIYQVSYPWLQQKRIAEARLLFMRSRALQRVTAFSGNRGARSPLQENMFGPPGGHLQELFASFDSNKDGKIQKDELTGLLVGLELEEDGSIPDKTQIDLWLKEFDVDLDGTLSEHEFLTGIGKWAQRLSKEKWSRKIQKLESSFLVADDPNFWATQSTEAKKVLDLLETEAGGEDSDGEEKDAESADSGTVKRTAALCLAGGAALAAAFADPLVDSIGGFSEASGIPPFFVAFVVTPFASNASELFSSIIFARGRRKKNISLTFSQLYGGVTMNNTLCLGLFLGLVYVRGLTWDFSSEVTVILLSVTALGILSGSRTTFPLALTLPVLAVYPLCISLVAVLDNVLGWH